MDNNNNNVELPTFFVSHGAPTMPLEKHLPAHIFLSNLAKDHLPDLDAIKAILVVSAHWETSVGFSVTSQNELIYDFYGFPEELYKIKYNAPPSARLSDRIVALLKESGFTCNKDPTRGLDHGAWVPLLLAFPEAKIPVVQLSLNARLDPLTHFNVGKALAPLRKEGVVIIGSGGATHNLRNWRVPTSEPADWSKGFDDFVANTLTRLDGEQRVKTLLDFRSHPFSKMAHPREEHFIPIFVPFGAASATTPAPEPSPKPAPSSPSLRVDHIHKSFYYNLSLSSFKFSSSSASSL